MTAEVHRAGSRALRFVLGCAVLATCVKVWVGPVPLIDAAYGQIPDAGAQRKELVDELRRTNQQLADLAQLLKTQTFKVRVEGGEKPVTGAPARPAGVSP